jgi:DNA mismatch endonuclease Vsr
VDSLSPAERSEIMARVHSKNSRPELFVRKLSSVKIDFHKTRPARLLLNKMAAEAPKMIPQTSVERFERLFSRISDLNAKHMTRGGEPFR